MKTRKMHTNLHTIFRNETSDHKPVVHNGVLFWNIMMQGRERRGGGYNNAFARVESNADYISRLQRVAKKITEIVANDDSIVAITLCEGPIKDEHIRAMLSVFKNSPVMQRFFEKNQIGFYTQDVSLGHKWGLLMLVDNAYEVNPVTIPGLERYEQYKKLVNRVQLWELTNAYEKKYLALAHFPYGGDVHKMAHDQFSNDGHAYSQIANDILKNYGEKDLTFCADFNFNPYLLGKQRQLDSVSVGNSILLKQGNVLNVTVDGVLLSRISKCKLAAGLRDVGLFARLKRELKLARTNQKEVGSLVGCRTT